MFDPDLATTVTNIQDQDQVLNTDEYQKFLDEFNISVENIKVLVKAVQDLEVILGIPLNNLETTNKDSIISAINSVLTQLDFNVVVGSLSALLTTDKANVVAAINELVGTKLDSDDITPFMMGVLTGATTAPQALTAIGAAATVHQHNASDINAGTLAAARVPNLDASKLTSGVLDPARIPVVTNNNVISSGGIPDLTAGQQADITTASFVITTDGRRWVWKGSGSKTDELNYIEMGSTNPPWTSISGKPTEFPPAAHDANKVTTGVLDEARIPTTFTTARSFPAGTDVSGAMLSKGAAAAYNLQDRTDNTKITSMFTTGGTFTMQIEDVTGLTIAKGGALTYAGAVTATGRVTSPSFKTTQNGTSGMTLVSRTSAVEWSFVPNGDVLEFWYFDGTTNVKKAQLDKDGLFKAVDIGQL